MVCVEYWTEARTQQGITVETDRYRSIPGSMIREMCDGYICYTAHSR